MNLLVTILNLSATVLSHSMTPTWWKLTHNHANRLLAGIFWLGRMTYTPFNDDDTYRPEVPNLWGRTPQYAPTPGYLDREWTPLVFCPSPNPEDIAGESLPSLHQYPSDQLSIHSAVECTSGSVWGEQSLGCIHYQIEWRAKLNNRVVVKDTKASLTQPPRSYWEQIKENAGNILRRKSARSRRLRLDDTDMLLSVNSQRDIDKHFEGTSVGPSVPPWQEDPASDID